jgi:hypothetical protein
VITNRYPGKCVVCGLSVPTGEGFAERSEKFVGESARLVRVGSWGTLCASEHCRDHALGSTSKPVVRRELTADGAILMPFDRDALPVIKACPGARWDGERKAWTVSLAPEHRSDLLARAEQLGLTVAPELLTIVEDPAIAALVTRAELAGGRPYQVFGVRKMAGAQNSVNADDMGLGKSFQALHAIDWTLPLVIVSPASVKGGWVAELRKWGCPHVPVVISGRKGFRWPEPGEAVIINWDILPAELTPPTIAPVLIGDECHAVSNYKAIRTKRWRAMAAHACKVICLSGTPLDKSPNQLKGVLESAGCMPWSYMGFLKAFNGYKRMIRVGGGRTQEVIDFRRDELGAIIVEPGTLEKLETVMLRRTKEQVAPELPPVVVNEIQVDCSRELTAELDALGLAWADELEADELPPLPVFSQIRKALATSRIPAMLERVAQYEETQTPLLVFSAHRGPIEALEGRPGWGVIHGGVDADKRTEIVDAFTRGELVGVGITIAAGGAGLNLQRAAHALFVDQSWAPRDNAQARARLHRIGQTASSVMIEIMVSDHIIDRHVSKLLWGKEELVRRTIDRRYSYTAPTPAAAASESREDWAVRVAGVASEREAAAEQTRRRELADLARKAGGKLSAEQGEERARLRGAATSPEPTAAQCADIQAAWAHMLSVCDGAEERDGQGFAAGDVGISRWLAAAVACGFPHALALAWSILRKYPRQVAGRWPALFTNESENDDGI